MYSSFAAPTEFDSIIFLEGSVTGYQQIRSGLDLVIGYVPSLIYIGKSKNTLPEIWELQPRKEAVMLWLMIMVNAIAVHTNHKVNPYWKSILPL